MVIELKLANSDKVALIDEDDLQLVRSYKWCLGKRGYPYAYLGKHKLCTLHRFILGLTDPAVQVDHKDRNPLNCQRSNMRFCTSQQNSSNRGKPRTRRPTSRFKGICWSKRFGRWRATLTYNYKQVHIGYFDDDAEAAHAYDHKALKIFGEFAALNFPNFDYSDFVDIIERRGEQTSSYVGVHRNQYGRWIARYKREYIGSFSSEVEAIEACESAKGACLS